MPKHAPPAETTDRVIEAVESMNQEMQGSVECLREAMSNIADEMKILRIAIDDMRAELEWTMRNHAPKREPDVCLPVKRLPIVAGHVPEIVACSSCDAPPPVSIAAATEAGWKGTARHQGRGWNYTGTCPACLADPDKDEMADVEEGTEGTLFS